MLVVTAEQMRRADRIAIEDLGIPSLTLMENAGRGALEVLKRHEPRLASKRVAVVTGRGNNAGDGFVVARLLRGVPADVEVLLAVPEEELRGDARVEFDRYRQAGGKIAPFDEKRLGASDWVIDALFGTGLDREVTGALREVIEAINRSAKPALALDVPSGLSADSGRPLGTAVRAWATATMGLPKIGLVGPEAGAFVGVLETVEIGIPPEVYERLATKTHWITASEVRKNLAPRPLTAHKGSVGHVLFVGGSATKPGAILMSGRSALRTGSGRVTVALPDKAFRKFPKNFLELMFEPLPSTSSGTLSRKGLRKLGRLMEGKDAVAAGPGMGVNADTKAVVRNLLQRAVPLVLDADALNCLAPVGARFPRPGAGTAPLRPIVLTPHPGEMARLVGMNTASVQQDRLETARQFAVENRVHLVLKGFRTVTAAPDGRLFINETGNPAMAAAGMGDVLTGMIASLIGQGLPFCEAVVAGVWLHGRAGDRVASRLGDRGLLAMELADEIPLVIKELLLE